MPSRTIFGSLNGNGEFWSNDPNGAFFRGTKRFSTTPPVVTVTSTQDTIPAVGSTVVCTYSSTQPGFWEVASDVPGASIVEAPDGLSCSITFVPEAFPVCSIYVSARCWNAGGSSIGTARVHPGMRGVVKIGSGAGWTYSNTRAAFDAVRLLPNPGGYAFVIQDGTYTADNMFMLMNYNTLSQAALPPCGEYTATGTAPNRLFNITRFTSVMAETPFGVVFDGLGTRNFAVELYGNTPRETEEQSTGLFGTDWSLTDPNANMRGIHLAGFVSHDTANGGFISFYCDHIFYEYLLCGKVSRTSPNQNNSCIQFQHSKDCLMSNVHSFGSGRYKQSTYQSKRCVIRRGFQRFDEIGTGEPHGGASIYRASWNRIQNILMMDSDQNWEWDTSANTGTASQDAGFLSMPATHAPAYPHHNYFSQCLAIASNLTLALNAAEDVTTNLDQFQYNNVAQWYCSPDVNAQSGNTTIAQSNGPITFNRMTSVYTDTFDADYGINTATHATIINDGVIYRYGYNIATQTPRAKGTFARSNGPAMPVQFNDCDIYQASYASEKGGVYPNGVLYSNTRTNIDPFTQGIRYPGRVEPSSNYELLGKGQDGYYKAEGKRGHFQGMSDETTVTGQNWLAEAMVELALVHYRAYTHTGQTNTQGIQTLSGNRGGATTDKLMIDYVISKQGRDVPFPLSVRLQKLANGNLKVSWRPFASAYMTNITGWRIYLDGGLADIANPNNHAVEFTGLISGRTYKLLIQAVDSVHGTSGYSYEVEAVA